MPELPEVEISRLQLQRWASGRTLRAVHVLDRGVVRSSLTSRPSAASAEGAERIRALAGRTADVPVRHGKRLGWTFGDAGFVAHYGMSGHWAKRGLTDAPPHLARLGLAFDDVVAWYVDGRRFGCVVPVEASALPALLVGGCGPDALAPPVTGGLLRARVACRKPLKVALMEQDRVAGLGNIHAAEACYRAKLSPFAPADSLSTRQWSALAREVVAQLSETVAAEAEADELRYVSQGGPNPFSVYDREGEPCARCGTAVAAAEQAGRTTYWCPGCQKA